MWLSSKGKDKQARARACSPCSPLSLLLFLIFPGRCGLGAPPSLPPAAADGRARSHCLWPGAASSRSPVYAFSRPLPPFVPARRSPRPPAPSPLPRLGGPMAYSQGGGKKKVCYYYDGERGRRGRARVCENGGSPSKGRLGRPVPIPRRCGYPFPRGMSPPRHHGGPGRGSPPLPPAPPCPAPAIGPAHSSDFAGLSPAGRWAKGMGWRERGPMAAVSLEPGELSDGDLPGLPRSGPGYESCGYCFPLPSRTFSPVTPYKRRKVETLPFIRSALRPWSCCCV